MWQSYRFQDMLKNGLITKAEYSRMMTSLQLFSGQDSNDGEVLEEKLVSLSPTKSNEPNRTAFSHFESRAGKLDVFESKQWFHRFMSSRLTEEGLQLYYHDASNPTKAEGTILCTLQPGSFRVKPKVHPEKANGRKQYNVFKRHFRMVPNDIFNIFRV